jgi:hypothetical protein
MNTELCPTAPEEVPDAVDAVLASRFALGAAERERDRTDRWSSRYTQLVAEYERHLTESLNDRARLREDMRAFGAYLRARNVAPEHLVPCVHEAMKDVALVRQLFTASGPGSEIVKWAIEGYYDTLH